MLTPQWDNCTVDGQCWCFSQHKLVFSALFISEAFTVFLYKKVGV